MRNVQLQAIRQLKAQMQEGFNRRELQALCFELGVNHENIPGETLEAELIELITYLGRRNELFDLVAILKTERPHLHWPEADWANISFSVFEDFKNPSLSAKQLQDREAVLQKLEQKYHRFQERMFGQDTKLPQIPFTNLEDFPDAVETEDDKILGAANRRQRQFKPGTTIWDVFVTYGFSLLILGEPGYGKTAAIYSLANQLLEIAKEDPTASIPIIVNLSTWSPETYKDLEPWLTTRLKERYQIPPSTSKIWLEEGQMILFLDAFDEVRPEYARTCLDAINRFQQGKLYAKVVVSSRTTKYEDLDIKLNLPGAVRLLALREEQVSNYFEESGIVPEISDPIVNEMLREPLMLNIFSQVFLSSTHLPKQIKPNIYRRTLFNKYIDMLFERRKQQLKRRVELNKKLVYIAQQMLRHGQYELDIENLQTSWLLATKHRREFMMFLMLSVLLLFQIVFLMIFIPVGLLTPPDLEQLGSLLKAQNITLNSGQMRLIIMAIKISTAIVVPIVVGVPLGIGGSVVAAIYSRIRPTIKPIQTFSWPGRIYNRQLNSFGRALGFSVIFIVIGVFVALIINVAFGSTFTPTSNGAFISMLVFPLGFGIAGFIFGYLQSTMTYDETEKESSRSNPRIWRSGWTGLVVGSVTFLSVFVILLLILAQLTNDLAGPSRGFGVIAIVTVVAVPPAIMAGLFYGGLVFIRHYILRWLLARHDYLPLRLDDFLAEMADFAFLVRIGIGYKFFHVTGQEHFAQLTEWPPIE